MDSLHHYPAPHEYPRQYPSNYTLPPAPYTHCSTAPIHKYCQPPMRALASFPLDDGIKSLATNTNYTNHYNYSPLYSDTISSHQSSLTSNPSSTDNRGANKQYDTLQQGHCVIHYGDNQSEQGYIHYDLASTAVHKRRGRPCKNSIKTKLSINSVKITSPTKQQESTTPDKTSNTINLQQTRPDKTSNNLLSQQAWRDKTSNNMTLQKTSSEKASNNITPQQARPDKTSNNLLSQQAWPDKASNNITPQQARPDKTSNNLLSQQAWPDKTSNNITPQQAWPDKTSNNITQQQAWPDKRSNNLISQQEWSFKTNNNITPQQAWPDKTSNNITQQQAWPDKRSNNLRSQQEWPIKRRSKPIQNHVVNRGNTLLINLNISICLETNLSSK